MGDETRKAIGLFWDIENCHVPRNVSALSVVQRLRERFFVGLREAEFMCVCDINKEPKTVIEELNNGQVNVVHISAVAKNAADSKICQSLRRFADTHPSETKVILISSDVNFASELSDLRHRKHMYIILIHSDHTHEALLSCAHEHYLYDELLADLPRRLPPKLPQSLQLVVRGYPDRIATDLVKRRLMNISNNCGGRIVIIDKEKAHLSFATFDALTRAKKRMQGEDVYGQPISVSSCTEDEAATASATPSKYKRTTSPGNSWTRSQSREGQQHSPAPGAPGSSSPVKHFRSQQSTFHSTYSTASNNYTANQNAYLPQGGISSSFQTTKPGYAMLENADVHSTTASVSMQKEMTVDYTQQSQGLTTRNVAPGQHQTFPEHPEAQSEASLDTQLQPSQISLPNLSKPPPVFNTFSSSLPITTAEGSVPGMLNISKTYNVTYQSSYAPPLCYPQPVYPYLPSAVRPAVFNPGPRQSARFAFDYNRPRSHNGNLGNFNTQQPQQQVRPFSVRGRSSTSEVLDDDDDEGLESAYFKAQQQQEGEKDGPVDLTVTNLDYNISRKEWRKILAATFQPQVQVLGICVRTQADNTSIASIKVPSVEDARYAISQFHRRKIGYKRINVAFVDDRDQAPAESTRQETIAVLSDSKGYTMPVFKFIENYEKRYHKSVSVSELYKMKDVVEIMDRGGGGRMVRLARGVCPTPSPTPDDLSDPFQEEFVDQPVCLIHCPEGSSQCAEAMNIGMLPNVRLQRKHFAAHVHSLLLNHNGVMPLMSFPTCYGVEFGVIPVSAEDGVPMEHLISCVPGVEIIVSKKGVKLIHFQENKDPPGAEAICGRTSPMLTQQMAMLSREIGDLLRQSRTCSIPASKFIPAYHHHFGRQCRVADYGYTKLAELFDALPHVLQVLGTGDRKVLTLTHRAQVKRFIADVVKVLKTQPGKQVPVSELPIAYERLLFRKFDIMHYGVAFIEDMFMDIPPTSILITMEANSLIMAIPKRDQTPEEIKRTEQFALEIVDLLKHNPQCRMTFNKFIPAYHHHFGRQCRVADFGFTRLTDLFESISHVVEIIDDEEERMIKLTAPEMRMVLSEQMRGLLQESPGMSLLLDQVLLGFQRQYGFPLRLTDYGVHDVKSLLGKIKHCIKVDTDEVPPVVKLRPPQEMSELAVNVVQLLMDQSGGCLPLVELCSRYRSMFGKECDVQRIQDELPEYVQVSTESDDGSALIRLTSLQTLGRDIRSMLKKVGCIALPMFGQVFEEHFFVELKPALYGFPDIPSILRALPHIVKVTGRPGRKFVQPSNVLSNGYGDEEIAQINRISSITRFEDYLSAPVPASVPSPELQPSQNMNLPDLMKFDSSETGDKVWRMSEEEKKGLGSPLCRTPTSQLMYLASTTLPSPNPPPPAPHVFPGNVPLSSPFPPPPPLPTDIAPPPLTEGYQGPGPQWPTFLRNQRPPFPHTRMPVMNSGSASDRMVPTSVPPASLYVETSGTPLSSSVETPAPLPSPHVEPSTLEELPAASLQWKEMLESGWWKPTPQQLQNLASMGLLGLGLGYSKEASELAEAVAENKQMPVSTPISDTLANGSGVVGTGVKSEASSGTEKSVNSTPFGSTPPVSPAAGAADVPLSSTDSSVVQSLPSSESSDQPALGEPAFTGGSFMAVKVTSPASRGYKSSVRSSTSSTSSTSAVKSEDVGISEETPKANESEGLEQALEESLNLSADGEGDVTVLEVSAKETVSASADQSPLIAGHSSSQSATSDVSIQGAAAAASASSRVASLSSISRTAVLRQQALKHQAAAMTPAGDASSTLAPPEVEGDGSSSQSSDNQRNDSSFRSIPANDSFSQDQPLDTSSTRSVGSGSNLSQGSSSDVSLSPSPRKNPRRARLAAKFFNPSE